MNLRGLVRNAITQINPDIPAKIRVSNGWVTLASGRRVPSYLPDQDVMIQFQPLTSEDVKQMDGLNVTGIYKSVHAYGNFFGVNREKSKGGDLFIIQSEIWMVVKILELWPDWCRLMVQLQIDPI